MECSLIVAVFALQGFYQTSVVTGIGCRSTVADLAPCQLSLLSAAATEKQIIVFLVICGGLGSIPESQRSAFQRDDNGGVIFVSKNMASKPISLPPEMSTALKPTIMNIFPVLCKGDFYVGIGCHSRKGDYGFLIGDIWTRNIINSPSGRRQRPHFPLLSRCSNHRINHGRPSVYQTFYLGGHALDDNGCRVLCNNQAIFDLPP